MNQWVMLVSAKSLVNWALRKRGKGLWRFLKVRHAQTDTEVVLLHSCRETSLSHRGTEGLGNQAPLCLARTARLEECLAVEALCTHERTHWKDIRLRWEEEARGQKKEKKSRIFMVRALWSDYWGIYWTPTVDFVIQTFIPIFVQRSVKSRMQPEIVTGLGAVLSTCEKTRFIGKERTLIKYLCLCGHRRSAGLLAS